MIVFEQLVPSLFTRHLLVCILTKFRGTPVGCLRRFSDFYTGILVPQYDFFLYTHYTSVIFPSPISGNVLQHFAGGNAPFPAFFYVQHYCAELEQI